MRQRAFRASICWPILALCATAALAFGQAASSSVEQEETAITGTVVSTSRDSMVVRTETGAYPLFVFSRDALKPKTIAVGSIVRVISVPSGEPGVRIANDVTIATLSMGQQGSAAPVPSSVRRLEADIERAARRFHMGFHTGAALDPEVLLAGVEAKFGPFFNDDFYFSPSFEFAFGEVTKMFTIGVDGIYRLPLTPRLSRWSLFVGGGPSFSFLSQNFSRAEAGEKGVDFGDLSFKGGLSFLAGIQFRSGMYLEAKGTVYSVPKLRFILGYTF